MNEGQLPNCERANVADAKLYRYLLNHEHPEGKSKARFYELVGYTPDKAEQLRADLLRLACLGNVVKVQTSQYAGVIQGRKYAVEGAINAPNGRTYDILSVWAVEPPDNLPRLITAFPNN